MELSWVERMAKNNKTNRMADVLEKAVGRGRECVFSVVSRVLRHLGQVAFHAP